MRIIETDNLYEDYPSEQFVNIPAYSEDACKEICEVINKHCSGAQAPRYWRVVPDNYELKKGFQP